MDYKKAGVDIEAGYKSVELMKEHVKKTMRPEVLGGLGGFAGAFDLSGIKNMEEPVLLSGTDGCGTKVKLAFVMDKHDTIGIDAVAMCVNDIACSGGEPLFFLDYIACGKNYPEKIASIVSGVAEGCLQSECALVGGETAEHPGLMPEDDYDLAGFAVGVVDKKDIIDGSTIKAGDTLIGLASSGVHSNGFSLVRKVFEMTKESLDTYYDELGKTLGEALIEPTRIYVKALKNINLNIEQGEFVAIVGQSGSGKSTLLHLIGGVDIPSSGEVIIDGKNIYKLKEKELSILRRRKLGFIFQFFNLIPVLTAQENIEMPVLLDNEKIDKKYMNELLRILGLEERKNNYPSQLSGGQQQRVSIGRALANKPSIILADEPTGNLDSKNSKEVLELLKYCAKKYNQTLILITHDINIAKSADRVITIEDGEIISDEVIK